MHKKFPNIEEVPHICDLFIFKLYLSLEYLNVIPIYKI